ncbi:transposase [Streptomyces sp. NPDC055092]
MMALACRALAVVERRGDASAGHVVLGGEVVLLIGGEADVMAGERRKFGAEFREGAVRIVAETGKPIPKVAKDLGINETNWSSSVMSSNAAWSCG